MAAMYCPNCRGEFLPEIDRCPDCDVELVNELPPEDHTVELVPVVRAADHAELTIVRSILEGAGIPAVVEGEDVPLLLSDDTTTLPGDGITVLVPRKSSEEARTLLQSSEGPDPIEEE